MILSVGIIGLVSISASPNGFPVHKKQAPKSRLLATFLKVRARLLRIPLKSAVGQSVVFTADRSLPVCPNKQTYSVSVAMSQRCHEPTSAV